jgi:hypothetical protein
MSRALKIRSFPMALGTNGTPSVLTSASYSATYVSLRTSLPGCGYSLMPAVSTNRRCRLTRAMMRPGMTNTCSVKKRDRVSAAMIGPASISCTRREPMNGVRPMIDAPMPSPQ